MICFAQLPAPTELAARTIAVLATIGLATVIVLVVCGLASILAMAFRMADPPPARPKCIRCDRSLHRVTVEEIGFPVPIGVCWYCNNPDHKSVCYFREVSPGKVEAIMEV